MRFCARVPLSLCLPLALLVPAIVHTQEVFGTLRRADASSPAQGAIVLAERLNGTVVARAVTGSRGTYVLRVSAERLVVRVLQVGRQPHVLDTVQLATGERRELSRSLPETAVVMSSLRTSTDSRCAAYANAGPRVAAAFSEARKALFASYLIPVDGAALTKYRITTEELTADDKRVESVRRDEYVSDSLRPFQSWPVDTLEKVGYVTELPQGRTLYRAPSAEVISDDRFLTNYCLFLVENAERDGSIGVGFKPARARRDITQIEGTLWLDEATSELQRLEYRFPGLGSVIDAARPGGWLEFTRLDNGLWFINRWELRMPRVGAAVVMRRRDMMSGRLVELTGVTVSSGEILDIELAGRRRFITGATDSLTDKGALVSAAPGVDEALACATPAGGVTVNGAVMDADGVRLPGADVVFEWRASSVATPSVVRATSDSRGEFSVCRVPDDVLVNISARFEERLHGALALRAARGQVAARVELVLDEVPRPAR